jgi:purine nucleosidase
MIDKSVSHHGRKWDLVQSRLRDAMLYALIAIAPVTMASLRCPSQPTEKTQGDSPPQCVIIDTDIGGDIDDVYALGLALQSPEFKILGILTEFEDTTPRARLVSRFLKETGRSDIPVAVGTPKRVPPSGPLNEARYAERGPAHQAYPNATDFLLEQIRLHPGEITLIAIGPETNLGEAIDRDIETLRKLKRVVIMGGSIYRGYNVDDTYQIKHSPSLEYNIAMDAQAAQKVFRSGVPLYVVPLDSSQIKLEELRRAEIVSQGTPMTDAITLLTEEWAKGLQRTPTIHDAIAVAFALNQDLCRMTVLNIDVDADGATKVKQGAPKVHVCLHSDSDQVLGYVMPRILGVTPLSATD